MLFAMWAYGCNALRLASGRKAAPTVLLVYPKP